MNFRKQRTCVLTLGKQVERERVRDSGHLRFKIVPGGETFAALFPSLVGFELQIGNRGVEIAHRPELIRAVEWLGRNGYFQRGLTQS